MRQFIPDRIKSADALAKTIADHHGVYEKARACASALPAARVRLATVFTKLARIDPDATFPPVTVLIGRDNSGGTTGRSGVLIGLEVICRATWLQPDLTDRMVRYLIAHEYGHVEQFPDGGEDALPDTVLKQSLVEGEAELIAELTSGEASESYLQRWTKEDTNTRSARPFSPTWTARTSSPGSTTASARPISPGTSAIGSATASPRPTIRAPTTNARR